MSDINAYTLSLLCSKTLSNSYEQLCNFKVLTFLTSIKLDFHFWPSLSVINIESHGLLYHCLVRVLIYVPLINHTCFQYFLLIQNFHHWLSFCKEVNVEILHFSDIKDIVIFLEHYSCWAVILNERERINHILERSKLCCIFFNFAI